MCHERQSLESSRRSWKRSVFLEETGPPSGPSAPQSWPCSGTGNSGWSCSEHRQSSRPAFQNLENSFHKLIDNLHFIDPHQSIRWKIRTVSHLNFDSYLPHQEWLWMREFVALLLRNLLSLLSDHRILSEHPPVLTNSMVDGLLANIGVGIVPLFGSWSLAKGSLFLLLVELILTIMNSLKKISRRTKSRKLITNQRFPLIQIDSICQAAIFCRGWAWHENSESSKIDWKRETTFHILKISRIIHRIHLLLHLLQLWSELLYCLMNFS